MRGGLINTDAVDNSGGVDTSDHEVNIKILLDLLVKKGIIKSREERNRILSEMTEDVAALVLADNENQSRALTLDGLRSSIRYEGFVDLIDEMILEGVVDRLNPEIPGREELLRGKQKDRGLPRPLLADLLGYTKMWGFEKLIHTNLPDSPAALSFLEAYFPLKLRKGFSQYFVEHPLRREITATAIINYVVNNGGIALPLRLSRTFKTDFGKAIAAYLEADAEAKSPAARRKILAQDYSAEAEHQAFLKLENSLELTIGGLIAK